MEEQKAVIEEDVVVKEKIVKRGPHPPKPRYKKIRNKGIQTVAPGWVPIIQNRQLIAFGWMNPYTGKIFQQVGAPVQLPVWATGVANICGIWFWAAREA